MSNHPALVQNRVAVVTGAASGIGLAASAKFAALGMKVCMADANRPALEAAAAKLRATAARPDDVRSFVVDVSNFDDVERLKTSVYEAFGEVALLMNNAGIGGGGGLFGDPARWRRISDVNLWGVINGVQVFAPDDDPAKVGLRRSSTPGRSRASLVRPATRPTMSRKRA